MNTLMVDFRNLIFLAGSQEGARVLFERLIVAMMRLLYRDSYNLRPMQGDWGIDCFSGTLAGGNVIVWQAKYFLDRIDDDRKAQIRKAFKAVIDASVARRFRVVSWALCVPCSLSPQEMQWWQTWRKKMEREHKLKIELHDEGVLRDMLSTRDAEHIRLGTFGVNPTWIQYFVEAMKAGHIERDILDLPDPGVFEDALFVQQLAAAEVVEMEAAKRAFFNAELMTQEITDRQESTEQRALRILREKVRSLWETRFNSYANSSDVLPSEFYSQMMQAVEDQSESNLRCTVTAATFVHKQGIGHQLAERCAIGWIRGFRERFGRSKGESA